MTMKLKGIFVSSVCYSALTLLALSLPLASAFANGIDVEPDTTTGATDLPFSIKGVQVMDMTTSGLSVTGSVTTTGDITAGGSVGVAGAINAAGRINSGSAINAAGDINGLNLNVTQRANAADMNIGDRLNTLNLNVSNQANISGNIYMGSDGSHVVTTNTVDTANNLFNAGICGTGTVLTKTGAMTFACVAAPTGPQGPQGAQGIQGTTGPQGPVAAVSCPGGAVLRGINGDGSANCAGLPASSPLFVTNYSWDSQSTNAVYHPGIPGWAGNPGGDVEGKLGVDYYNNMMVAALQHWGPLEGLPESDIAFYSNMQNCMLYADPNYNTANSPNTTSDETVQGSWGPSTANNTAWQQSCGGIMCHYILTQAAGHDVSVPMSQNGGLCGVQSPECGGVTRNGWGVNWNCLYQD